MVDVPVTGIAEVDVAMSGRDGIAAAVESLRSDGVVILRRAVDPMITLPQILQGFADTCAPWWW